MSAGAYLASPKFRRVASWLLWRARSGAATLRLFAVDATLAIVMIGVLRPVAALLPYPHALRIARAFGVAAVAMPFGGRAKALQMRHAYGENVGSQRSARVAAELLARPLCDSVVLRRVLLHGRSDFDSWRVEQRTTASVDELRASDESFILVTGHFSRQACMPLYVPEVVSHRITSVLLPPTTMTSHPRTWWLSYHYGQMLACLRFARPDMEFVYPGQVGAWKRIVEKLGGARNAVILYADAPQAGARKDNYARPFAGLSARRFATGAARLSRMTRRPIAVCIPHLADDQTVVLDWTRVIRPPAARGDGTDRRVTDTILGDIEKAVGRRPAQYILDCLGERRWDAQAERWL